MTQLTQADAQRLVDAALERAQETGVAVSVAVMDSGRELLAFTRMDGALLVSIETALGKAYAARSLNRATGDIAPDTQPGGPFYALEHAVRQPFVTFGGGDVVRMGDEVVGAVGIAGGSIEQDQDILAAALQAITDAAAA
ncbi:MAG: hypothetical protein QOH46_3522 [Solirubrobacteraceae bacterium]|nr:hypothetical protein [Solirubrobacteraceae bacterium]